MWFSLGRSEGFPTQYADNPTPVTVDLLDAGLITAFIILAISFLIALPTTGFKTNLYLFLRISINLLIGLFLLLGNVGQEWEVGEVHSLTPYKAGSPAQINASISVKIGLRSVNVTLRDDNPPQNLRGEIINYNERFEWTWDQGRLGFGPFAGKLQQEFRAAQYRGVPLPILWVVEYFVIDGEGFRFGRFYRTAGWYTHIILWSAFALWIVANILFRSIISYGAYCLGAIGVLQLCANLVWLVVRNPVALVIPFEDNDIRMKFGFSFWVTFSMGIITISIAIAILVMEYFEFNEIYSILGLDPLNDYDELVYLTKQEKLQLRQKTNDLPLLEMNAPEDDDDSEYIAVYMKRRTIIANAPNVIRTNKPKHLMRSPQT